MPLDPIWRGPLMSYVFYCLNRPKSADATWSLKGKLSHDSINLKKFSSYSKICLCILIGSNWFICLVLRPVRPVVLTCCVRPVVLLDPIEREPLVSYVTCYLDRSTYADATWSLKGKLSHNGINLKMLSSHSKNRSMHIKRKQCFTYGYLCVHPTRKP